MSKLNNGKTALALAKAVALRNRGEIRMRSFSKLVFVGLGTASFALLASPACAQASRTWVSGVGDDVNPCSRTAPCKTFAGAISKTAAGGEINCLDPGGFGSVTITKAIAIVCGGIGGTVFAHMTTGIVVNAGDADKVLLSGLDINGGGTGKNGVRVIKAGNVVIRNTVIHGFATPESRGISVEGAAKVTVTGTTIANNRVGLSGKVVSAGGNVLAGNDSDGQFAASRAFQ